MVLPRLCGKLSLKAQPGTDFSTKPSLEPDPEGHLAMLRVGRGMFGAGCVRLGGRGGEERFILTNYKLYVASFLASFALCFTFTVIAYKSLCSF